MKLNFIISNVRIGMFLLLLFFFNVSTTLSQTNNTNKSNDYKYTLGEPYPVINSAVKEYFPKGESIIAVKQAGKTIIIQKFNRAKLNQVSLTKYSELPSGFVFEGVYDIGGRLQFFFSLWDKSNRNEQLFSREISYEKGCFIGDNQLLLHSSRKINPTLIAATAISEFPMHYGMVMSEPNKFDIYRSLDSSKFMVQFVNKPENINPYKATDKVGLYVFDSDMKKIWGREIEMRYYNTVINIVDYAVDSKGNAYLLTKLYKSFEPDSGQGDKRKKENPSLEILKVSNGTDEPVITKIDLDEQLYVYSILISESPSGDMVCAGFFNNGEETSVVIGFFTFKLTADGKVIDKNVYGIPQDLMYEYLSEKQKSKLEKEVAKEEDVIVGLRFLRMRQIIFDDDGSYLIIGEQAAYTGGSATFVFNDLFIVKFDTVGEGVWAQKLPKRQLRSKNVDRFSYKLIKKESFCHIFILDSFANFGLPTNQSPAYCTDHSGYLTSYKINSKTGEHHKISIVDVSRVDDMEVFQFDMSRLTAISEREFVMEFYKKEKEDILFKIEIGEPGKN